ncbi:probable DNA primase large subunit, partial [Dendrobium catenatum]|uniref:probable DNA primase large subunit n=1 Tax=Dendrobium catenatum TaxID=906689 RepID=UPI0010A09C32
MEILRSQKKPTAEAASNLSLYRCAPSLEVRLDDFELYAIDRLRVLKGISNGLSRGKRPDEMETLVNELWRTNMRHPDVTQLINKDLISHFVLRLVYCRTDELRKWFLSMETALFRYRFRLESLESQRMLMAEFQLPYKALNYVEYERVKDKLTQVSRSIGQSSNVDTIFFKVPFEEVPELVANRRVFLLKGNAYVAMNQVASIVVSHFRSNLSKALVLTNRKWTSTIREQEKDRLTPIVEALGSSYLGPDYSQPMEFTDISLKDIDQLANTSFPLCMRHLFNRLREDHHLKHGGRMQLGLFLKERKFSRRAVIFVTSPFFVCPDFASFRRHFLEGIRKVLPHFDSEAGAGIAFAVRITFCLPCVSSASFLAVRHRSSVNFSLPVFVAGSYDLRSGSKNRSSAGCEGLIEGDQMKIKWNSSRNSVTVLMFLPSRWLPMSHENDGVVHL